MEVGKPETYGGVYFDDANRETLYTKFKLHSPPEMTANTRVIALLGVEQEDVLLGKDDWFVSDFFAFWHLLNGLSPHQTWLHSLDFQQLIAKHEYYLHGNPYKDRKVVLDAQILERANSNKSDFVYAPQNLKQKFGQALESNCKEAAKTEESILVLIFSHEGRVYQPYWRVRDPKDAYEYHSLLGLSRPGSTSKLQINQFKAIFQKYNVNVTLLTTACYSGGWICHRKEKSTLNISTLSAAGPFMQRYSWRRTVSDRFCGSIFASAIIKELCEVSGKRNILEMADDDDMDWNEEQVESFAEFIHSIHELLLTDIDARGYTHELSFGAKDDNWSMKWRERTGIPLSTFQDRWNELKDVPRHPQIHPGDPSNHDPHVSEQDRQEYRMLWAEEKARRQKEEGKQDKGKGKAQATAPLQATRGGGSHRRSSALYGGTVEGLTSTVIELAKIYLPAFSYGYDNDDSAKEGGFHEFLRDVAVRKRTLDVKILEMCLQSLNYRLSQIAGADEYLEFMEVPKPNGQSCLEFNTANLQYTMGKKT